MAFHAINPPGHTIPGLSQAVKIDSGPLLLLSGHVPFTAAGAVAGPALDTQLEQVFANLDATLKAAGSDFSKVAKLTIYVCDLDPAMLPVIRAVRDRFIDTAHPPSSTLVGVAALFHPEVRVEIEAIATSA